MKLTLEQIDPNMLTASNVSDNIEWFDCHDKEKFSLFGLYKPYETDVFCRMDPAAAKQVSPHLKELNYNTAGARVCFSTDSCRIALHYGIERENAMFNMPWSGSSSFDIYLNGVYHGTYRSAPGDKEALYQMPREKRDLSFPKGTKHIVLNFPCYSGVKFLRIGLEEGSVCHAENPYSELKPILYYGSSITQGGCASRPGLTYQNHICRKNGVDYINLGFSGSAKGEPAMAEYLASIDCSIFVCDFDHNINYPDILRERHLPLVQTFRDKHPETPIVLLSRPDFDHYGVDTYGTRQVVKDTYDHFRVCGDKNIYFLDGETLFGTEDRDACTMDGTHPNDLGFYRFYKALYPIIEEILQKK